MDDRRQRAEHIAQPYIGTDRPMKDLGSGAAGFVFPTESGTAVKVFAYREKFDLELAAYRRLTRRKVFEVCGFSIPRLVNWNRKLMVIEMTIVVPPFLLDF